MSQLLICAEDSLRKNIIETSKGTFLAAGGKQFRTLWIRDFCFSIGGLLLLGEKELVKNQLLLFLENQNAEGLIPRGLDVVNPKIRVLAACVGIKSSYFDYSDKKLKPEYFGEHGTIAADSNLLTLIGVLRWTEFTDDTFFFDQHSKLLSKAFSFLDQLQNEGLLSQASFSDWQDSAKRKGKGFYLNLLYLILLRLSRHSPITWISNEKVKNLTETLFSNFFDSEVGLFREKANQKQFSLESQLWCIQENLFSEKVSPAELWSNLKTSPLFSSFPGHPVWPNYPSREISWSVKLVGLRHYHDELYWSWLLGETLKTARKVGDIDVEKSLVGKLEKIVQRENSIHEIYRLDGENLNVFRTALYRSEAPFSWGASKIIEGLLS